MSALPHCDMKLMCITKAWVDVHIENSLSGIQLLRVGKIPFNSIQALIKPKQLSLIAFTWMVIYIPVHGQNAIVSW